MLLPACAETSGADNDPMTLDDSGERGGDDSTTGAGTDGTDGTDETSSPLPRILDVTYETGELTSGIDGLGSGYDEDRVGAHAVSDEQTRTGTYALRSELHHDDALVFSGKRSESDTLALTNTHFTAGQELYYGFSIYIPDGWVDDGADEDILFQWKRTNSGPHAFLGVKRHDLVIRYNSEHDSSGQLHVADFVEGAWNDIVVRVHWSPDLDGSITAWHKAASADTYGEPTEVTGVGTMLAMDEGSFNYLKWGLYCPKWNDDEPTAVTHRVVFHDNVRVADSFEAAEPTETER